MTYIKEAWEQICKDAQEPDGVWLTMYCDYPFYGGPEEGGWWGTDCVLQETMYFQFENDANGTKEIVQKRAEELNELAKRRFGDRCLQELEWLDARGLDSDYLPEPDGEEKYFVVVEKQRGSFEHHGDRQWS